MGPRDATVVSASGTLHILDASSTGLTYKMGSVAAQTDAWPVKIVNTNTATVLQVLFDADLTLSTADSYFICGSSNIQFGSRSLKEDGNRPVINVYDAIGYPGLIQNGSQDVSGYDAIYVCNLVIKGSNGIHQDSALSKGGGWLGQRFFGKGASNNRILNCASRGKVPVEGGGIVGYGQGCSPQIIGCMSNGDVATEGGGIAGKYSSADCIECQYIGSIASSAGGILGWGAAGTATRCMSQCNTIEEYAGGIVPQSSTVVDTCMVGCLTLQNNAGSIVGSSFDGVVRNSISNQSPPVGPAPSATSVVSGCYTCTLGAWDTDAAISSLSDPSQWVFLNVNGGMPYPITLGPSINTLETVTPAYNLAKESPTLFNSSGMTLNVSNLGVTNRYIYALLTPLSAPPPQGVSFNDTKTQITFAPETICPASVIVLTGDFGPEPQQQPRITCTVYPIQFTGMPSESTVTVDESGTLSATGITAGNWYIVDVKGNRLTSKVVHAGAVRWTA